jgi:hypothetical protein
MIVDLFDALHKEVLSLFCFLVICLSAFLLIKRDYEKENLEQEIRSLILENNILNSMISNNK